MFLAPAGFCAPLKERSGKATRKQFGEMDTVSDEKFGIFRPGDAGWLEDLFMSAEKSTDCEEHGEDGELPVGTHDLFAPTVAGDPKFRLVMPTPPQAPKLQYEDITG